jgi:hypothetical protein
MKLPNKEAKASAEAAEGWKSGLPPLPARIATAAEQIARLSRDIGLFIEVRFREPDAQRAGLPLCSKVRADGGMMRIVLNVVASLMVLAGVIWFLQGINVLPGSFMTGQIRWAVYGGIAFAAGIALLLLGNRPRKAR